MKDLNPDKPFKIVVHISIEHPDHELDLMPTKRKAIAQVAMTGEIFDHGIAFTAMDAAHDCTAPKSCHEIIENMLPMMGDMMRKVRTGKIKPDVSEQRYFDGDTGKRVPRDKLHS